MFHLWGEVLISFFDFDNLGYICSFGSGLFELIFQLCIVGKGVTNGSLWLYLNGSIFFQTDSNYNLSPYDVEGFATFRRIVWSDWWKNGSLYLFLKVLIFLDLFPIATMNGLKYSISLIDDFSRYPYVFLIADKSSALDFLRFIK